MVWKLWKGQSYHPSTNYKVTLKTLSTCAHCSSDSEAKLCLLKCSLMFMLSCSKQFCGFFYTFCDDVTTKRDEMMHIITKAEFLTKTHLWLRSRTSCWFCSRNVHAWIHKSSLKINKANSREIVIKRNVNNSQNCEAVVNAVDDILPTEITRCSCFNNKCYVCGSR